MNLPRIEICSRSLKGVAVFRKAVDRHVRGAWRPAFRIGLLLRCASRCVRVGAAAVVAVLAAACGSALSPAGGRVGAVVEVSRGCAGQNAEVQQAIDLPYVYETWIGCGGIGFARSVNGGRTFDRPVVVAGSAGGRPVRVGDRILRKAGWDPAIAVAPGGAVYVSYMIVRNGYNFPRIATSLDHGASFAQVSSAMPPAQDKHNWGDRDYIDVAPDGTIYLTWDFGPDVRSPDANIVVQKSTDGGRTWSHLTPVSPGYPSHGGDVAAPLLAGPGGRIDVLLWVAHDPGLPGYALPPGHDYYTTSADGGRSWSHPVPVGPGTGQITGASVTWIDASLGIDSAGTLYATWDTQQPGGDIGWLSYSIDHGRTWSQARRVTSGHSTAEHIMAVTGWRAGTAYIGWLSDSSRRGFAAYLRAFSIRRGWLSGPIRASASFGDSRVWPGDTIGISVLGGPHARNPRVMLSWGSAPRIRTSQIWAAAVRP